MSYKVVASYGFESHAQGWTFSQVCGRSTEVGLEGSASIYVTQTTLRSAWAVSTEMLLKGRWRVSYLHKPASSTGRNGCLYVREGGMAKGGVLFIEGRIDIGGIPSGSSYVPGKIYEVVMEGTLNGITSVSIRNVTDGTSVEVHTDGWAFSASALSNIAIEAYSPSGSAVSYFDNITIERWVDELIEGPVDWSKPRLGTFRFWRVDAETWLEHEEITTIHPGGSISRNMNTALKESGKLTATGLLDIGDDLVRVYYTVEDDDGGTGSIALATMYAEAERTAYSAVATTELTLYSSLLKLQDDKTRETVQITAGSNAVAEAIAICEDAGLPVVASASPRTLTVDASWEPGTSWLDILNYLLDVAGYWSADVDGWGRVVLEPYEDPASRVPVWAFEDGANSVFMPDVELTSGAARVPNVCVLVCSRPDEAPIVGVYENDDPASPYSTVTRGREIVVSETVNDAVDAADLVARAKMRLLAATSANETYKVRHAYVPVGVRDVVSLRWGAHGIDVRGAIQSQEIQLTPSATTTSTLKRVG